MLAGVLLTFCLAPVRAVAEGPLLALPVILAWALTWRFKRLFAIPPALLAALAMIAATTSLPALASAALLLRPVLGVPEDRNTGVWGKRVACIVDTGGLRF